MTGAESALILLACVDFVAKQVLLALEISALIGLALPASGFSPHHYHYTTHVDSRMLLKLRGSKIFSRELVWGTLLRNLQSAT